MEKVLQYESTCAVFPLQNTVGTNYIFAKANMEIKQSTMTSDIISKIPRLLNPQEIFIEAFLS
jgi:hypothetical protein